MKFTREIPGTITIKSLTDEGFRIGDRFYPDTLVLSGEGILDDWVAKSIDELSPADFESLLATEPEVILLGTGAELSFAPRELMFAFARRGTGFEVMDSYAAARTFNVLVGEGRRVAAVLYPAP